MTTTLQYEVLEGWEHPPANLIHEDVAGVEVDRHDRVFILTRREPRLIIYAKDGSFLRSWGEGIFSSRPHGLTLSPDGTLYCVDEGQHVILHLTETGDLISTIGNPGIPSDTGHDGRALQSVVRSGPPFNRPTNIAVAPNGDLYASDGYGNARVHHFDPDGRLLASWGAPGRGAGEFHTPHDVAVTADGRVLVADRENDRIQVFDGSGGYMEQWTNVRRPTGITLDAGGHIYVTELWWRSGERSQREDAGPRGHSGRLSILSPSGDLLARLGDDDALCDALFIAPHDVAVDSEGALYVGEVTWTFAVDRGLVPAGSHSLRKLNPA